MTRLPCFVLALLSLFLQLVSGAFDLAGKNNIAVYYVRAPRPQSSPHEVTKLTPHVGGFEFRDPLLQGSAIAGDGRWFQGSQLLGSVGDIGFRLL